MKSTITFLKTYFLIAIFCAACFFPLAQKNINHSFHVVPLGVKGGIDESNLSAYMVAPTTSDNYVCLDAGTLYYGIEKAIANKVFRTTPEEVIRRNIKAYLISHAHLDHLAGLIINSPDDTAKNIYALQSCIQTMTTHYFTWQSWANFADAGEPPLLKKYSYKTLQPDSIINIQNTTMSVQAFILSHANLQSTAFLIRSNNAYLLYLGDTGADTIEKSNNLYKLWENVAPLIRTKQLKSIFIETSFPDNQSNQLLFGHLTPKLLMKEMERLETLAGKGSLRGFSVVITHMKPPQKNINLIKKELVKENVIRLHLIFPEQGSALDL